MLFLFGWTSFFKKVYVLMYIFMFPFFLSIGTFNAYKQTITLQHKKHVIVILSNHCYFISV